MAKIKILVCYHKKAPLFKNEVLVPIHAGRACAHETSKDGVLPKEEFEWLCSNMIGDDTRGGQNNISRLNREINEWSVIYWAWKNYGMLGNPDYIGLMHYRRALDFRSVVKTGRCSYIDALGLKKKYLEKILRNYDFVYRKGFHIKDNTLHTFECYQPEAKLSENYHPLLYKEYKKFNYEQIFYPNNIFIMKREDFHDFCNECIPLMLDILKLDKEVRMETFIKWLSDNCSHERFENYFKRYKENGNYYPRHVGYLMEYISSFYFMHLIEKYRKRALECNILITQPPKIIPLYKHKIINPLIKLIVGKDKYKKFKKDPIEFFDRSNSKIIHFFGKHYI